MSDQSAPTPEEVSDPPCRKSTLRGCFRIAAILVFVCVALMTLTGNLIVVEFAFELVAGWFFFLRDVGPRMRIVWSDVAFSFLLLAGFVIGFHFFLRRILMPRGDVKPWRWQSTGRIASLVVLLFVTSISMIGLIHQIVWTATSDDAHISSNMGEFGWRLEGQGNLQSIYQAMDEAHEMERSWTPIRVDKNGRPLHGWPALLLPHLDVGGPLHRQIDFERSWDDGANRAAFQTRVKIFDRGRPSLPLTADGFAPICYSANARLINASRPFVRRDITDGSSNTILLGEINSRVPAWGQRSIRPCDF